MALPVVILLAGGLLVVQYWTSDKIALASAGARIVDESQAPELHAIVQRSLCRVGHGHSESVPVHRMSQCTGCGTDRPVAIILQ